MVVSAALAAAAASPAARTTAKPPSRGTERPWIFRPLDASSAPIHRAARLTTGVSASEKTAAAAARSRYVTGVAP